MNILLVYYDEARKKAGDVAVQAATRFASHNDFDLIVRRREHFAEPMLEKPKFINEYMGACDRLIYIDADVLMREEAKADELFVNGINVSTDGWGLCVGFCAFKSTPAVRRFVRIWSDLGIMVGADRHDQTTFKFLVANFAWITELVHPLPMSVVSNPDAPTSGTHAHHFWTQFREDAGAKMLQFRF